jgi:pantoate--beta-alanine ligase
MTKPASVRVAPDVVTARATLTALRATLTGPVGVVMTMGALHDGHAALMRQARSEVTHLIATIFVNPLQFGPAEDFDRYPRTFDSDVEVCAAAGVDVVFAPDVTQVYPAGEPSVTVSAGTLATVLEGSVRPGHFDGVLTVVLKLLNLTRPEVAYFGEKDYQQLTLIRAMVADLDLAVRIVGVPTVREPDGLARSSRNRYLSPVERETARVLPRALRAGVAAASAGATGVVAAARAELAGAPGVVPDYLELTGPDLGPAPRHGSARLLVAARVGKTRLIDNMEILLP